jgi:pimeloyl-ACP methyl ester carboxylesterase
MLATSVDGIRIAYEVVGGGSPLVLLHGFTEARESWREAGYVGPLVRAGRSVVLIDCRGHGDSDKPHDAEAYAGDKRARDVLAVLDALQIEAADLFGYSMGGLIAIATALRFPERVRTLMVMSAHPFAQDMAPYRHAVADGIGRWMAMVAAQGVELSGDSRRRMLANDIRALQACTAQDRQDMSAALVRLRSPTLAIAGTGDPIFKGVKTFAEQVGGEFVALDGKNHITAFLDARRVVPAVDAFLSRVADRGA